jgi:hypothetical protein
MSAQPTAFQKFRTGIAGQKILLTFGSFVISPAATFEVQIDLSLHSGTDSRRAGQLSLVYRFGDFAPSWTTGRDNLLGVVTLPQPTPGDVVELTPQQDVSQLWPELLATDNSTYGLVFTATSAGPGSVSDVELSRVEFQRPENDIAGVQRNRQELVATYQPDFPELTIYPGFEYNPLLENMNAYGIGQYLPDYSKLTKNKIIRNQLIARDLHAQGAIVSLNHVLGYDGIKPLPAAGQLTKRRAAFSRRNPVKCFGAELLEVWGMRCGVAQVSVLTLSCGIPSRAMGFF